MYCQYVPFFPHSVSPQLNLNFCIHFNDRFKIFLFFSGEEHTTYNGKVIKKREQVLIHCRCHCYHELSVRERAAIFQSFNSLKVHESQNIYLRGCVNLKSDKEIRRRPRSDAPKSTGRQNFSYIVTSGEKSVKICQAAFLGLHGIKALRHQG